MKRTTGNGLFVLLISALVLACGSESDNNNDGKAPLALVVTTDYQSGAISIVNGDLTANKNVLTIHSDVICRYDGISSRPYLVSRLGADAVQVLDAKTFAVAKEYSTGAGSNPQDMLPVSAERAYVSLYSGAALKVVNPLTGDNLGQVDISTYADSDGVPEAAWMEAAGGKVFVALQRLTNFMPGDKSSLLVLNAADGKVQKEIPLSATNPFGKIRFNHNKGKLVVSQMGNYGVQDGGVEFVTVDSLQAEGLFITETELGGDVQDAVVLDDNRGWAVVAVDAGGGKSNTEVVAFSPKTGKKTGLLHQGSGFVHGLLELSPDGKQLWVTDRSTTSPGVRIFDAESGKEIVGSPLDVGLPPFMICFVK